MPANKVQLRAPAARPKRDVIRVLLLEDDEADYLLIARLLRASEERTYELEWTRDPEEALDKLNTGNCHVCLLDYRLGLMDGLDVLRRIAQEHISVPTLMLTGRGNIEVDEAAMRLGAKDYLDKGNLSTALLTRAIRYALRNDELERQLRALAQYDPLTGLLNLRAFQERIDVALRRADRSGQGVGLLFMDLDGFKPINDALGHQAGDLVLQEAARRVTQSVRDVDEVGRLGGDEFAVALEHVGGPEDCQRVADTILANIKQPFVIAGESLTVGVSIGVAIYPLHAAGPYRLLQLADAAMYHAKANAGNRVSVFQPGMMTRISGSWRACETDGTPNVLADGRLHAVPKGVHVLLVEDDDVDALAVERAFAQQELSNLVTRVRDGSAALAALRGEGGTNLSEPRMVLLDLNMPRMDGIEFLKELRKDEVLRNTVVFVLTTSNADEDRQAAYDLKAAGYFLKSNVGGFLNAITLLETYWQTVEMR